MSQRPPRTGPAGRCAALVPVKGFRRAKTRLRAVLTAEERATLARDMAECVIRAASGMPTIVMTADPEITGWARRLGCGVLSDPRSDFSDAVGTAVSILGRQGYARVAVIHADLPLATDVGWLGEATGVLAVPDRRVDGTNVLSVPAAAGFRFAYGPGSFARHAAEARRLALPLSIVDDAALGWDVDHPQDLCWPDRVPPVAAPASSRPPPMQREEIA